MVVIFVAIWRTPDLEIFSEPSWIYSHIYSWASSVFRQPVVSSDWTYLHCYELKYDYILNKRSYY